MSILQLAKNIVSRNIESDSVLDDSVKSIVDFYLGRDDTELKILAKSEGIKGKGKKLRKKVKKFILEELMAKEFEDGKYSVLNDSPLRNYVRLEMAKKEKKEKKEKKVESTAKRGAKALKTFYVDDKEAHGDVVWEKVNGGKKATIVPGDVNARKGTNYDKALEAIGKGAKASKVIKKLVKGGMSEGSADYYVSRGLNVGYYKVAD